ncbi:VOC family protein [Pseudarthrobacter sp. B907]|uniref:VOC family protein n=1 Tax=Pseudarthrobacter sp. B907 TaxID=3158261 RepID=UPI0032D9B4CB
MLRVRPIHFTSRPDQWERLLEDLGMVKTVDEPAWREFDAGAGRLALHVVEAGSAEDGTTAFGVEAGDLAEFARRTNEAGAGIRAQARADVPGTTAELIEADHGPSCRITAADGFSFIADPATRAPDGTWAGSAEADPDLAVVGVWFAADPTAAARALRDIGARPRPVPGGAGSGSADADAVETEAFTAKNGGVLMVGTAGADAGTGSAGLGFEYGGDLELLRERLAGAGHEVAVVEEAAVALLHVGNPDAGGAAQAHAVWISAAPAGGRPV